MSKRDGPSGPARRAIVRWAWRLFRREWRQQVLLLTLMTVTVAAAVAGAAMAVNASSFSDAQFGDASGISQIDVTTPDVAAKALATAQARFGTVEVVGHASVAIPGSVKPLDLRAQDPQGTFSRQLFLGDTLDPDGIEAEYQAGVLTLRIPISERAKPRKVEISSKGNERISIDA